MKHQSFSRVSKSVCAHMARRYLYMPCLGRTWYACTRRTIERAPLTLNPYLKPSLHTVLEHSALKEFSKGTGFGTMSPHKHILISLYCLDTSSIPRNGKSNSLCVCIYIYRYIYIYIYVRLNLKLYAAHIQYVCVYIYTYTYLHMNYMHMYAYIHI